jgi:hypothetical protein
LLAVFGPAKSSVNRGYHINAPLAKSIRQRWWDVLV